jgi:hypothetical protein
MNSESIFFAATWANGDPSIDIDPYDYSKRGLFYIIHVLEKKFSISNYDIVGGMEDFSAAIYFSNEKVEVLIDNWSCSIAFESVEFRDEVLEYLQNNKYTPDLDEVVRKMVKEGK